MSDFLAKAFDVIGHRGNDTAKQPAAESDVHTSTSSPIKVLYRIVVTLDGVPDMVRRPAIVAAEASSFKMNEHGGITLPFGKKPILKLWREKGKEDRSKTVRLGPNAKAVEAAINAVLPLRDISDAEVKKLRAAEGGQDPYKINLDLSRGNLNPYKGNLVKVLAATLWVTPEGRLHRDPNEGPAVIIRETRQGHYIVGSKHNHESDWLNGEKVQAPKPGKRLQSTAEQTIVC